MEPFDRSDIEIFVEKNTGYYSEKWASMDDAAKSRVSWNWAAALGGLAWMLYRKLYVPIGFVALVVVVDVLVTSGLEEAGILPTAVAVWDKLSYWAYSAVFGSWGNYWYFLKFRKAKEDATQLFVNPEEQRSHLARKGGTNLIIAGIGLISVSALAFWVILDP